MQRGAGGRGRELWGCCGWQVVFYIAPDTPIFPLSLHQGHLHDRYGQLVSIYTRLLLTKISFHAKVRPSAASAPPELPPCWGTRWGLQGHVLHQQNYQQQQLFGFFLLQSTTSSPQALKCQMRCWKRRRGQM